MSTYSRVGVIIPFYNMTEYIERCILSIVNEKSVGQIIIVNDGSTDNDTSICEKLSRQDNRITIINTQHKGVVAARNLALEKISTDYITFVDADDWIEKGMLDDSVQYLNNNRDIDIYINGMCREDDNGIKRKMFKIDDVVLIFDKEDALTELFKGNYYRWELCGKVYRSSLFNCFQGDESVIRGEDLDSNWILFNKANKVTCNSFPRYHYYYNAGSAVNTPEIMLHSMYEVYYKILNSSYDSLNYVKPYLIKHAYREVIVQIKRLCCDGIEKNREQIKKYQTILMSFSDEDVEKTRNVDIYGYLGIDYTLREAIEIYGNIDRLVEVYSDIAGTITDEIMKIDTEQNDIFFYGTGSVAKLIIGVVNKQKMDWNGFIVSDLELKKSRFYGRPVLRVSEIKDKDNVVVILAMNEKNEKAVIKDLYIRGFRHVKSLIEPLNSKYRISDWV